MPSPRSVRSPGRESASAEELTQAWNAALPSPGIPFEPNVRCRWEDNSPPIDHGFVTPSGGSRADLGSADRPAQSRRPCPGAGAVARHGRPRGALHPEDIAAPLHAAVTRSLGCWDAPADDDSVRARIPGGKRLAAALLQGRGRVVGGGRCVAPDLPGRRRGVGRARGPVSRDEGRRSSLRRCDPTTDGTGCALDELGTVGDESVLGRLGECAQQDQLFEDAPPGG